MIDRNVQNYRKHKKIFLLAVLRVFLIVLASPQKTLVNYSIPQPENN